MRNVLTIILAGGRGARLEPLTRERAKPGVPFGGSYRIVDFPLSNCVNSGLNEVMVLTQYKSSSLDWHLQTGWLSLFPAELGHLLQILPPQQRVTDDWYLGTADAVYQNIYSIERRRPDYVVILAGDHIYKMDYGELLRFHLGHGGPATVATIPTAVDVAARQFGILEIDRDRRVCGFEEKPAHPRPIPGSDDTCLASMGIYVFSARFLVEELCRNAANVNAGHDFGHNILPAIIDRAAVYAYSFEPSAAYDHAYWRDVGTVDAYYEASLDLLESDPALNLHDERWPIRSVQHFLPPPKVADGGHVDASHSSMFAGGSVVRGTVSRSIIGRRCKVDEGVSIENSIVFDSVTVGRGARLRNVIVDKFVVVPPNTEIGFNHDHDRERGLIVSDGGVTCVPKNFEFEGSPSWLAQRAWHEPAPGVP